MRTLLLGVTIRTGRSLATTLGMAALLCLAACGGGGDNSPGTPTTPTLPTIGAPATLAISGGDAQSGFAGTVAPVSPAVTVRDAAGQLVPGATVSFVVTAGGGSIAGAVAASNAQGVATAGSWMLGPSGEQIVEARLGNLTPARFRATVSTGLVDAVVPSSGGIIEITTPAHPYRGLKLTIPSGAFSEAGQWRFELAPNAPTPTLPAGFTVNGPALHIQTDRARAGRLMTLRIPAPRIAGSVRLFILSDPTRSAMEIAPIVAEDSASITVLVGHLNASMLLARRGSPAASRMAMGSLIDGYGYSAYAVNEALGLNDAFIDYLRKAWPSADIGSYKDPAGEGAALMLMNLLGEMQKEDFAAIAKELSGLRILADTATFATLQIMADRHRRSLTVQLALNDLSAALAALPVPNRDSLSAINLSGGLAISRLSQMMVFEERFGQTPGRRVFSSMFGKGSGTLLFSTPTAPTTQTSLTLGPGGFGSPSVKEVGDATPFNAQGVLPLGGSFIYPIEDFADVVPTMVSALLAKGSVRDQINRNFAAAAGFPDVRLEVQNAATGNWVPVDTLVVIRDSSALLRAQCSNCTKALPQDGSSTLQSVAIENYHTYGSSYDFRFPLRVPLSTALDALGFGNLNGAVMTQIDGAIANVPSVAALFRAAVPFRVPIVFRPFRLETDSQRVTIDSLVTFRAKVELPPPNGYTIDWDFGDNTPVQRTSNTTLVTHRFSVAGTAAVRAVLRTVASGSSVSGLLATTRGKVVVVDNRLVITPGPLLGPYGYDYTLTATSGSPTPPNARWVWELGDGRILTTTTNTVSVRFTAETPAATKRFELKVTLKSGTDTFAVGNSFIVMWPEVYAWKFTAVSIEKFSGAGNSIDNDVRWKNDSLILSRIAAGVTQGGFQMVTQAMIPNSFPLRTAPVGLYLLEGPSLTLANLDEQVSLDAFGITTFPNASTTMPTAPKVNGWNLVEQSPPANVLCNVNENAYAMNGSITQGRLVALRVPLCMQQSNLPNVNGQRLMSMDVDVTFAATTASGTISVIYYFYPFGAQAFQRTARLTFSATRLGN